MSCVPCCSVQYCCSDCLLSDREVHSSSGECCFFADHLKKASPSYVTEGTSDVRASLRLLYFLEMHALVSSDSINRSSRIGGLSTIGILEVLKEGGEVAETILKGSMLMSSARKMRTQTSVVFSNGLTVEIVALWAVMINSVEVQISDGWDLGIAVYGPSFSWFNHSCFPNASYRFALAPPNEDSVSERPEYRAVPASKGVAADAWHAWQFEEDSTHALGKYGPRVVVRCIKPINKADEVCITYIDLLQTREARHSDLWSKYKFICSCERCTASPESYVDFILNCDFRNLNSPENAVISRASEDFDDILQQAISEYSLGDDPKACCVMIESLLSENLMDEYDRSYGRSVTNSDEGGYNKTSKEDYGRSSDDTGGFNKSSNDNNDGGYKSTNTDDYSSSGGYDKSSTDSLAGGLTKSSTDDYNGSGSYNKTGAEDYSASGDYKSSTDDFSGGHNKTSTDGYGSGYKDSSTDDHKSSSDDYDGGYKNSSADAGYGEATLF
ncbi:hypothetical protein ZWY2020_019077 [Hordeum vulgare]|nr:hypothetical protein ZWY2020_019077 [Hordeum vulgare]